MTVRVPTCFRRAVLVLLGTWSWARATPETKLVSPRRFVRVVSDLDSTESWCPMHYCWSRAWEAGDTLYAAKGMYGRSVAKTWKVPRSSLDDATLDSVRSRIAGRDSCRSVLYDKTGMFSSSDSIAFESVFESVELLVVARWPETNSPVENIRLDLAYHLLNAGLSWDDRRRPVVSGGLGLGSLFTLAYGHGLASDWSGIRARVSVPGIGTGLVDHDHGWFSILAFDAALSYQLSARRGFLLELGAGIDFAKIRPALELTRRQRRIREAEDAGD